MSLLFQLVALYQWRSYTGAHWGTGPTISLYGPTINNLTNHVHGVYNNMYFNYTLQNTYLAIAARVH